MKEVRIQKLKIQQSFKHCCKLATTGKLLKNLANEGLPLQEHHQKALTLILCILHPCEKQKQIDYLGAFSYRSHKIYVMFGQALEARDATPFSLLFKHSLKFKV